MKFSKNMDKRGIAPLIIVGLLVLVIAIAGAATFLTYSNQKHAGTMWADGINEDNAAGYIVPYVTVLKDYNGKAYAIMECGREVHNAEIPQAASFTEWVGLEAVQTGEMPYHAQVVISWGQERFTQDIEFGDMAQIKGPDGNYYQGCNITGQPMVLGSGTYWIEFFVLGGPGMGATDEMFAQSFTLTGEAA